MRFARHYSSKMRAAAPLTGPPNSHAARITSKVAKEPVQEVANEHKDTAAHQETIAERDARLIEAFKEKLGGDATAQFENGEPTEMKRSVRKNMFRCKLKQECAEGMH
jgi:hypothetical protein